MRKNHRTSGTCTKNDYTNVMKAAETTLNSKHRTNRKQKKHMKKKKLVFQKKIQS